MISIENVPSKKRASPGMAIQLYPDAGDFIIAAGMIFDVGTAYLSFRIARMSKYTPIGWYLITIAWTLKIGRDLAGIAADLVSPGVSLETVPSSLSFVVSVILFAGVFLLMRTFQELMIPSSSASSTTREP